MIKEYVEPVLDDPRVAVVVSAVMTMLPDATPDLAKMGGVVLMVILIWKHLLSVKKLKLEIAEMERKAGSDE